jgi:N-methylhydantoinase A
MSIVRISNSQMADLVRRVTVERGYDPRTFALLAYGGAGPSHVAGYGGELGVSSILVPAHAAVFSALGVARSDLVTIRRRSDPMLFPPSIERMNDVLEALEKEVLADLRDQGLADADISVRRSVDMRYRRQVHELSVGLPNGKLSANEIAAVAVDFQTMYERVYGAGAAYKDGQLELISFQVTGVSRAEGSQVAAAYAPSAGFVIASGERRCIFPDTASGTPSAREWSASLYALEDLQPGNHVLGPAILEGEATNVVIPPGYRAIVDPYSNILIEVDRERAMSVGGRMD